MIALAILKLYMGAYALMGVAPPKLVFWQSLVCDNRECLHFWFR